ncbi:hypothetical protein [Paenibacillus sonchi]|uniref:hypothetical protein n=1 Tax=Paenibacillus sonchi TaxID=373687 RepID=UPI001E6589E3|nr:hypothetical protein [Paenibacillus sonchi]
MKIQNILLPPGRLNRLRRLLLCRNRCRQIPYDEEYWIIQVNGGQKALHWSEEYCQTTPDAKKLKELRNKIVKLVQSKPEYQALPEAVGGYE